MYKKHGKSGRAFITLLVVFSLLLIPFGGNLKAATTNTRTDAQEVTAAKAALLAAGTLKPIQGQDTNIIPLVQKIVNNASSGVVVQVRISYNSQVDRLGNITYGSEAATGNVTFKLTKGRAIVTEPVPVYVAASKTILAPPSPTDSEQVAAAKAALSSAGTLKPVQGQDTSVVTMAQSIVNKVSSGVTVKATASTNPQVSSSGVVTYSSTAKTGNITFSLGKNSASATLVMPVTVAAGTSAPVLTSVTDVKDYGAKGDGVTDDTAAINNAITAVSQKGGGEVYIPNGVYRINPDTSVKMRSNVKLTMSSSATLKSKATSSGYNAIIKMSDVSNVEVSGGKVVGDRYIHTGSSGAGHGIRISGSNNVRVSDVMISDVFGDGIYIGSTPDKNYNQKVVIEGVTCDNNRRNGITVISAKDLKIVDCVLSHSNGAIPQAGLDLEPNDSDDYMENIVIDNLRTIGNAGYGINFYILINHVVTIDINNFTDIGSHKPYNDYMNRNENNPNYHVSIN